MIALRSLCAAFSDRRLAAESRGVLGFIALCEMGPQVSVAVLASEFGTGRDRMARIINELVAAGYVERRPRRERGAFSGIEYRLAEALREACQ